MSKNIVFFVHGLGVHGAGWSSRKDGPIETLKKEAARYLGSAEALTGSVDLVEIRYDDIFDKILSRWAELGQSLNGTLPQATPGEIADIAAALEQADDPDNWFAAELMDLVFYTKFKLVRRLVQLRVASSIMNAVARQRLDDARRLRCVVVAHSLGTTVAHDAIHLMTSVDSQWLGDVDVALQALNKETNGNHSRQNIEEAVHRFGTNPFAPHAFNFDALFMVSNTSRLLCPDVLESTVHPPFGANFNNCCKKYFNVDHFLDPISKVRRLRVSAEWPEAGVPPPSGKDIDLDHLHFGDIHSLEHYLLHPAVHAEILFAATDLFTMTMYRQALARLDGDGGGGGFPRRAGRFADQALFEKFKQKLESVLSKGEKDEHLKALLTSLASMRGEVRTLLGPAADG